MDFLTWGLVLLLFQSVPTFPRIPVDKLLWSGYKLWLHCILGNALAFLPLSTEADVSDGVQAGGV